MITPSFAPTATERVLPKLALDFTTASLDPRITFTRALATATRINSSGYIESVAADTPRFDYTLNTGGSCNGLLIEEARTNIATYSQSPTNWFKAGTATVSGTAEASPDGTSNAYAISSCEGYANRFGSSGSLAITGGSTITFSIYLKSNGNGTGATLQLATAGGTYKQLVTPMTITSNWARYSITMTTNADNTGVYWIVYGSTGTTAMVPWGAQVEVGAFATSYIPTTTTVLTRNADVATMTGTNFSSWYNVSEGTMQVQADLGYTGNFAGYPYPFAINDNSSNNEIAFYASAGSTQLISTILVGGVNQLDYAFGTWTSGINKAALAYKQNSTQMGMNASAKNTDTSCNVPTVTQLAIGRRVAGNNWTGHIQKINYWPQRLTGAELAAFTK